MVKRKRPKPGPKRNFKPEVLQMNEIHSYQRALRELVRSGGVTDPDVAARIEAGWHPGIELAVMSVRPDLPDAIKTVILKVLLENTVISATDKARLEAAETSPASINIVIAPWAAAQQPKAIEHRAAEVDYISTDKTAQTFRQSPPSQAPIEPAYQEMEMRPDGGGVERSAPIEQPQADAWKPRKYVFNERTATYDIINEDDDGR
jgi:hypothetical protein